MAYEQILEAFSILGKIVIAMINFVKSKRKPEINKIENKVVFPKNQVDFEKLIPFLDKLREIPELWEIPEIREFHEKYRVIRYEGKLGIINKKVCSEAIYYKLLESKDKELKQKINLIPSRDAKNFEELKDTPQYTKKTISEVFSFLNNNYKSLLSLAVYIETLYKQKRFIEIEIVKKSIKQRYGEKGLRFCNCYQTGYIERLISISSRFEANDKLDLFLRKPIYFIFGNMDDEKITEIKNKVQKSLNENEDYIAVHSLGLAANLAKYIVEEVSVQDNSNYDIISIDKENIVGNGDKKQKIRNYSQIWYHGEGKNIFLMIKDLL